MPSIVIGARYTGPAKSGNGGYSCGAVARFVASPAEVTLRAPPTLETPLEVRAAEGGVDVHHGELLVATGRATALEVVPPAVVRFDVAEAASATYAWRERHPIPTCFVCSPFREDGLRIFPGRVPGTDVAAAPWRPDASVADESGWVTPECVWAALDCPSYFGIHAKHGLTPNALLGRLAARIDQRPRVGEPCVLVGWCDELDGRKHHVGSALWSEERGLLAVARATWVTLRS